MRWGAKAFYAGCCLCTLGTQRKTLKNIYSKSTPIRTSGKKQEVPQMDKTESEKIYQEYADQCAIENGDLYNTEEFRKILSKAPFFEATDKLLAYEKRIVERALKNLRSKKEWQDLEAEDVRHGTKAGMYHMGAYELLDRYKNKIQTSYRAEKWFYNKIQECNKIIVELKTWQTKNKARQNRIQHWQERRLMFELKHCDQVKKSNRYENLIFKWLSICETIKQADIAKEIKAEREGVGNKYGFNPKMQLRETSEYVFNE